jgi:hypothetical protein
MHVDIFECGLNCRTDSDSNLQLETVIAHQ